MSQNVTTNLQSATALFTSLQIAKAVNGQKFTMPELSLNSSMFSWVTEDDSACHVCQEKSENIYTFAEAVNLQPAHPNCRCKIVPLVGIKEATLTSIAPNYLLQKNSGETSSIRDKLYNKINLYAFEYDNADGELPCEIERRWVAYPVGETNNCVAIISDDKLSFLTMDNFESFFAITENGESTSFGKSIMNPQNALVDFRATGYTKTGIDFYDEGIAAMSQLPTGSITQEGHYSRNQLNIELEWDELQKLNERLPYNYCPSGVSEKGHFTMDMWTYYKWKNTLKDLEDHQERERKRIMMQ